MNLYCISVQYPDFLMFNLNFDAKLLINCYPYNLVLKGLWARTCTSELLIVHCIFRKKILKYCGI